MDNKGPRRLLVKHLLASATNRIMLHTLSREQLDAKWHALESLVYDRDRDVQMLALWQMAYICDACLDDPRAHHWYVQAIAAAPTNPFLRYDFADYLHNGATKFSPRAAKEYEMAWEGFRDLGDTQMCDEVRSAQEDLSQLELE